MIAIRFAWDPVLVSLRRDVCPKARWDKSRRTWLMAGEDAQRFLIAAHERLSYVRRHSALQVSDEQWGIGFQQGAPFKYDRQS